MLGEDAYDAEDITLVIVGEAYGALRTTLTSTTRRIGRISTFNLRFGF